MGFWEHFPYSNFHDFNLDWIVSKIGEIKNAVVESGKNKENSATNAANAERDSTAAAESARECRELVDDAKTLYNAIGAGRRFILIGDSYGVNTTRDNIEITGWCTRVKNLMGFNNYLCTTKPKSGSGFVAGGEAGNFKSCLEATAETVESPEGITDIIVLGGYNDYNFSISDIQQNIVSFRQRAKELYPNAVVTIGFIGRRSKQATIEIWKKFLDVYKAYSQADIAYVDNIQYACRDKKYFVSDGVHPNNDGEARIAKALVSWIQGGYNAFENGNITIGELTGFMVMDNGCTTITFPTIALSGAQSASIDVGLVETGWALCTPIATSLILTGSVRDSNDNKWHNCQFYANFNEYCHLILRPRCVIDTGFLEPEKYKTVSIPAQTVTIATMAC